MGSQLIAGSILLPILFYSQCIYITSFKRINLTFEQIEGINTHKVPIGVLHDLGGHCGHCVSVPKIDCVSSASLERDVTALFCQPTNQNTRCHVIAER